MSTFQEDGFLSSPEHESLRRGEEEGEDPGDGDHQPRPPPHAARVQREQRVADHQVPVYGIYCMFIFHHSKKIEYDERQKYNDD